MAQIVDELIIRLGLDPSEFEKGRKRAVQDLLQTRNAAQKTGKDIEDTAKRAGAGVERLTRNIIGMFAAFAGAKSLTELVTGLTKANAEIGRFSANVALAPQSVAAWGMAVQRIGGDAGNAQGSIAKLSSTITNFRNGLGQMPQEFWFLRQRSGVNINPLGSTEEVLTGISEAIQRLSKTDRQSAFNFASALGIDDKTFEVMRQHGAGVKEYLQTLEKYAPSNRAIQQATKLQEAWAKLVQTIGKVVQDIMEKVSPHLEKIVNSITAMVERLTNGVDWASIDKGMSQFASLVSEATKDVDGLTLAVGAFFALWTGAKFAKVLANMLLLRGGGVAAAGGAAGGGAMASLTRSLPWLAALGVLIANKSEIRKANQDSIAWTEAYNHSKELVERGSPGPSTRGGRRRGIGTMGGMRYTSDPNAERLLHPSLMNDNLNIEGRPVGKGNPVPVVLSQDSGSGPGLWDTIKSWFTGTAPGAGGGGSGFGGVVKGLLGFGGSGSGGDGAASGGDGSSVAASVPNITGMTEAERNELGLILKYESRGKNVMNYMGRAQGLDPNTAKGYTAQGYYQILNSNWRRLAPKLGIKTTNAMASSLEDQTKVALALRRESGIGNWANFNPSLRAALKRGEKAGAWGERVPEYRGNEARAWPGQDTGGLGNLLGAQGTALSSSISNDNRQSSNTSNVDTRIGHVTVNTQATDARGVADRMFDELYRRAGVSGQAAAANTGPV